MISTSPVAAGRAPRGLADKTQALLLGSWLVLLIVPFVVPNEYVLGIFVSYFINLILIASLNLIMGYCGQISMCHAGFYGLGAYVSGVLTAKYGVPPLAGMLAAIVSTTCVALLVGLPSLRLKGHYLAMATLGSNAVLSVLFVELVGLTGGPNGLTGVEPLSIAGFAFDTNTRFFYLAATIGLLVMLGLLNLIRSRTGRAMASLTGNEIGAASLGVDTYRLKVIVFTIGSALAALAGVLYVHYNYFASPETFTFAGSVMMVVMVAVGGRGHYWGGPLGALVLTAVPELLRSFHDVDMLVFGAGMILVLMFFPDGLAGLFKGRVKRGATKTETDTTATPARTAKEF